MNPDPRSPEQSAVPSPSDMQAADSEYTPVCDDPVAVVSMAREHDMVIVCEGASATHSFFPVFTGGGIWVARRETENDVHSWTVDYGVEDTIENCIRRCDPDVRLVEESVSPFADGGGDDGTD